MPALPAYVILAAAVPLLVPTAARRLSRSLDPPPITRRTSMRSACAVAAACGLVPLAVVLVGSPLRGTDSAVVANEILVPVDGTVVSARATRRADGVHLSWSDSTSTATTFYRVLRTRGPGPDVECVREGADRCELRMDVVSTTRARSFVDPAPVPGAVYRIGVAANWLDDPEQGDIVVVSPPVATPIS